MFVLIYVWGIYFGLLIIMLIGDGNCLHDDFD